MLTCVVLPVTDVSQIRQTADYVRQAKRDGLPLRAEVVDWLDWAEDILLREECSIGTLDGIITVTPIQ